MTIQLSDHFTYKKLLRFCLSPVVMMVFTSIYGVVDGLFVSNFVGTTPFAAINLVMPFIMILGGFGFMLGTGGSALVAKTLGQKNPELANRYFTMIILLTLICGAILSAAGIALMEPISLLLGATPAMLPTAWFTAGWCWPSIPPSCCKMCFKPFWLPPKSLNSALWLPWRPGLPIWRWMLCSLPGSAGG